jgi:hypothetical protein
MCKIGLISWPITNKSPFSLYINLGEIYDKEIKDDISLLSQFNRDLKYLYPFKYSLKNNKFYNSEDFKAFRTKYHLTTSARLATARLATASLADARSASESSKQDISDTGEVVFRTPVLYDLTCMVPVFEKIKLEKITYNQLLSDTVFIVVPTLDPICRGKILDEVIANNPKYIILTGSISGENKTSTITLMTRYLRKRGVPTDIILRCDSDKRPTCILDCLALIDIMELNSLQVSVACSCLDITLLQKSVRAWRRLGVVNKRISYYCPYY